MRDAITGLIGRYDQLGRYLDRDAIERIAGYFDQAALRLAAVELINREAAEIVEAGTGEEALDDEWTYGARHRYWSSGYGPVYTGSHHSRYYDGYDTRSFDTTADADVETDEGGAGFGDS